MPIRLGAVAERLEALERLDLIANRLHAVVTKAFHRAPGRQLLSGTALGHPVHPVLVTVPIGCFTSAVIADLGGQGQAARLLTGAGLLAMVPATATGLSDWVDTADAERRIGFLHLCANVVAGTLYVASWRARRHHRRGRGTTYALAGTAMLGGAGWLGGHLAYAMGVGVNTTAFDGGPTEWARIAGPGRTPDLGVEVDGVRLAVFHEGDTTRVLADRCTHRGGPLSEGTFENGCVTCPWHGSRFAVTDGHVVRGPATQPQPVYEVAVSDQGTQVRRQEFRSLRRNPV